jgi:Peptidase inhibitor family I36
MKCPSFVRRTAVLTVVVIMSLSTAAVAANAGTAVRSTSATALSVSPDFTCPSAVVCIFKQTNFAGAVLNIPTSNNSHWFNLTNGTGFTLPFGSFNDNSGSSIVLGNASTGATKCFLPHTRINAPDSVRRDRYIWIEFGVTDCSGRLGPLP